MYRGGSRMPYDAQGTLPASPTMAATTCPRRTATISDASTSAEITRASLGRRTRTGSTWDAGERGGTARFCRVGCAMPEHKTGQSQRPIRVAHIVFRSEGVRARDRPGTLASVVGRLASAGSGAQCLSTKQGNHSDPFGSPTSSSIFTGRYGEPRRGDGEAVCQELRGDVGDHVERARRPRGEGGAPAGR